MLNNLKTYLEKINVTPISWLVGISGIMMVRFFLESLSNPSSSGFFASDASTLIHYYSFFLAVAVVLMIFLQIAVPSWKKVIPQLTAISFLALLVGPLADWIISGGNGFRMAYLFEAPREMMFSFLSFFGKNLSVGVTWGIRIEMALLLLFIGLFVYFAQKSWRRAIVSVISLYVIMFVFLSFPGIMNIVGGHSMIGNYFNQPLLFIQKSIAESATVSNNLHSSFQYSSLVRMYEIAFNFIMGKIFFLILMVSASVWFRLNFREKFKAVIRNSRPERVSHFILMIFFGLFAAHLLFPTVKFNWNDWLSVIILCFSFYFSWVFAVCVNDIVDEDIDAVSNANRPLIANSLSKEDMKQTAAIFLVASLISGFLAGYTAFFFVLVFTALYYIYSTPPTRFKIIPFFSSFIIGLCTLTAVMAGFFLLSPLKYVSTFPPRLALAVVVIFSLLTSTRDMKDIEGDKKVGIKTIPILFGDVWGQRVIGIFASLSFLLIPIFSGIYILFAPAIPAAIIVYYFVNRKPYVEKYIFRTYFAFVLAGILLLLL
jgi:4-hydroxybenzoate polyprenyltransferase